MNVNINQRLIIILSLVSIVKAWYSCPFNDGSYNRTIFDDVVIQAECTFLTSPLEWDEFNPNTFDGIYYNQTKKIPLTDLHLKRLFFSQLPPERNSSIKHAVHYWLVNGGGGSQYGMEAFGISMLNEIVRNRYHILYPQTRPIMYLFQYRGAGMSRPSIHCHTARSWTSCAEELIRTTVPTSPEESLKIIHAISNANIAQDLQYQIQYAINESLPISPTSTYIYGLSQGTGIIGYYLSIQSIKSQLQSINGVILDGVMSVKNSDVAQNQIHRINDRFYLYLSKCQEDLQCLKTFRLVTGSDQDLLSVALRLQMLFLLNQTNPACTTNLGLNSWSLFTQIGNLGIETVAVRPLTAILIARIYRCSSQDQRDLLKTIPLLISLMEEDSPGHLIDPPDKYPDDGAVLSITTIWSDFLGMTLDDSVKTNPKYFNELCIQNLIADELYLAPSGIFPICNETKKFTYNYSLPLPFKDVLYPKNPKYWGKFQVNPKIFQSEKGGALLFNGDLDYNSPLTTAQQVEQSLQQQQIPTKFVVMKGLTHVTSIQSYMKQGGFQIPSCTERIISEYLYQQELNITLSQLNDQCNSQENLIAIDWFYQNPTVNQTLHLLFANSTYDYWGID